MKKFLLFLIVIALVFGFSGKAFAANGKPNKFIVKYLYQDAFARGYAIGVDWVAMGGGGNAPIYARLKSVNNPVVMRCKKGISFDIEKYVTVLHKIVSRAYFGSIKNNLYHTCFLGVLDGFASHPYR
ncbi:MAG: hypothetical protein M1276_00620 [Deltaproteobacteria bacterium]|jgi:hypothetical protein|nr:hypothetical protein [Deltaproteobacteria bacterium]